MLKNNKEIFSFLNPQSNDILTTMSNNDRLQMLTLLKQYYLEFRTTLGFNDSNITLGPEIEFENARRDIIEQSLAKKFLDNSWFVVDEGSVYNGGEIRSPILTDTEEDWKNFKWVCNLVNDNATILCGAGAHVHIGAQILGNNPKYWKNFALLWAAYEPVIFRVLYGEFLTPRPKILEQARPISLDIINDIDRIIASSQKLSSNHILRVLDAGNQRKKAINLTLITKDDIQPYELDRIGNKRTVECRVGNPTYVPVIWQGYISMLVHLFLYAKSDKFDEDIILRRIAKIKKEGLPSDISKYSRIYTDYAIELADLIFNNNLDKIYFLRQYIKSGEVSNIPLTKSKPFYVR